MTSKSLKKLSLIYLILVGLVGFLFSPFCQFYIDLYPFFRITVLLSLLLGWVGVVKNNKLFIFLGKTGCWLYVYCVLATIVPDEEYYYFNNLDLPEKNMVLSRLMIGFSISILLLFVFGKLKSAPIRSAIH